MESNYNVTEKGDGLFEIDINGEIVKIDITGTTIQKDLEGMSLIKEGDDESFHGYLIKSAKLWIARNKAKGKKDHQ